MAAGSLKSNGFQLQPLFSMRIRTALAQHQLQRGNGSIPLRSGSEIRGESGGDSSGQQLDPTSWPQLLEIPGSSWPQLSGDNYCKRIQRMLRIEELNQMGTVLTFVSYTKIHKAPEKFTETHT